MPVNMDNHAYIRTCFHACRATGMYIDARSAWIPSTKNLGSNSCFIDIHKHGSIDSSTIGRTVDVDTPYL